MSWVDVAVTLLTGCMALLTVIGLAALVVRIIRGDKDDDDE